VVSQGAVALAAGLIDCHTILSGGPVVRRRAGGSGCLRPIEVRNPLVPTYFVRVRVATQWRRRDQFVDVEAEARGAGYSTRLS
jgi:hypothetical protein